MTYEDVLTSNGFERRANGSWRQVEGPGDAATHLDPDGVLRLGVSLDLGVQPDGVYQVHIVGSWSTSEDAARELPDALQRAFARAREKGYSIP